MALPFQLLRGISAPSFLANASVVFESSLCHTVRRAYRDIRNGVSIPRNWMRLSLLNSNSINPAVSTPL